MSDDAAARWAGVNHLALVTNDMDETVRFYHGVLQMPLVGTISAGPMRPYFFPLRPPSTGGFFGGGGAEGGGGGKAARNPLPLPAPVGPPAFPPPPRAAP